MGIEVRKIEIGSGKPKICVPIVATNSDDILNAARELNNHPFDIVEWRADCYDDVFDFEKVLQTLKKLRDTLGDAPILFTFRTLGEGGNKAIESSVYEELLNEVCNSKLSDLIDIEIFFDNTIAKNIIKVAHQNNVYTVASNHDFNKTPDEKEIINRLSLMKELDADILKIAVMPQSKLDVITLLSATVKAKELIIDKPLVTISMGFDGLISRISGSFTGSAITFGSVQKASAPGQIDSADLQQIISLLSK